VFKLSILENLIAILPFSELGLAWLVPAFVGGILGYCLESLIEANRKKVTKDNNSKKIA
jgi:branched-subunit amino acid permease